MDASLSEVSGRLLLHCEKPFKSTINIARNFLKLDAENVVYIIVLKWGTYDM